MVRLLYHDNGEGTLTDEAGPVEMLPSLDNFVSYGSDVIKNNEEYKRMLVDIYTSSISGEHLGENDRVNGSQLAESILLNLRGHVDNVRTFPFLSAFLNNI